ncbi:single-stranded DNA-binding protein [Glutamicibacter ardleyensis]|uniref:single-stranded DNA-binding protein n=1 Tax=Glutamicibacter ardleyensis TaxID=225894 RepID=UPI003F93BC00
MAGETVITVIGNLTADPELRFTPSGSAVANFTIASTPRTFDRQSNEWKDGEALFLRASVWREAAENVAETFTKGMRVIAQGRLRSRSYDTKEGERRTVMELEVDEIGPSLRFASAKVTRTQRSGGSQGGFGNNGGGGGFSNAPQQNAPQAQPQQQQQPQQGGGWNAPSNDPWSTGGNNGGGGGGGWGNPGSDEPPF